MNRIQSAKLPEQISLIPGFDTHKFIVGVCNEAKINRLPATYVLNIATFIDKL